MNDDLVKRLTNPMVPYDPEINAQDFWDDLCGEAKARLEQLTLERDKFLSGWNELRQELYHADVSIEALQADNARLREALTELLEVSRRAVRLSIEHDSFKLYAMEPMERSILLSRAALNTGKAPARSDAPATDLANQIIDELIAEADIGPGDQAVAGAATDAELEAMRKDTGIPCRPTQLTFEARKAVNGEGPRGYDWADKPHRVVFDLCREIEKNAAIATQPEPVAGAAPKRPLSLKEQEGLGVGDYRG